MGSLVGGMGSSRGRGLGYALGVSVKVRVGMGGKPKRLSIGKMNKACHHVT